jgi:phage head maturation protease
MTFEQMRASAAADRSGQVRTRADRPSQRRSASEPTSAPRAGVRATITLDERVAGSSSTVDFVGVASVYERGYEMWDAFGPYSEVVTAGAAQDLGMANLDVPLVLEHESLRRIARTTNGSLDLSQNDSGLNVHAPALDMGDADVAYIVPKMRSKLIDEMSFKFLITDGMWSPEYTEYRINGFSINRGDVAIVGYGASPWTSAAVRTSLAPQVEARVQRALTDPERTSLATVLGSLVVADDALDDVIEALAAILGVPSPDSCDCCAAGCTCADCAACAPGAMAAMAAAALGTSVRLMPQPGDLDARTLRV